MEQKYLYQVLPFLNEIDKTKRTKIEQYFNSAPVWLMDSFKIVNMETDTIFVREGTPAETIYVIGRGKIRAVDYRVFGIAFDFTRFDGIYGMGGMEVIMDRNEYETTLQTVTPCTMICIPRKQFKKWLETDIKALKQEAKAVGEYLLDQGRWGRAYLFLQGAERLILLFTRMYDDESKGRNGNIVFELKTTRQELAERSGLCVKTVNRAVKRMQEDGMIDRDGHTILITKEQYQRMKATISKIIEP